MTRELFRGTGEFDSGAISNFSALNSNVSGMISADDGIIHMDDLEDNEFLRRVTFAPKSRIKAILGFQRCAFLSQIEISSSVEQIDPVAFCQCILLKRVPFLLDCQIRVIHGFLECISVCRIEIPLSVKVIGSPHFFGCTSLRVGISQPSCRMRQ